MNILLIHSNLPILQNTKDDLQFTESTDWNNIPNDICKYLHINRVLVYVAHFFSSDFVYIAITRNLQLQLN